MITFHPGDRAATKQDLRALFARSLQHRIRALEKGSVKIWVPRSRQLFERRPKMAYHFKPELFIQIGGTTEFTCPERRFDLGPGEICVMPRGVPHGEVAADRPDFFENLVVCYYNETVSMHVAHRSAEGRPLADEICFFSTPWYGDLVAHLNRYAELEDREGEAFRTAARGLMLAELSLLLALAERPAVELFSETERIFRCQWLIRNNIDDPDLGVEVLARELHCSSDHLSRLFHQETGQRIVEYITRIRLKNATEAIRQTELSVKEIASGCGFADANYFAKVFRKMTGNSPMQYRQDARQAACAIDTEPKVVYSDHEEFGYALQPQVMARAEARLDEEAGSMVRPSTSSTR